MRCFMDLAIEERTSYPNSIKAFCEICGEIVDWIKTSRTQQINGVTYRLCICNPQREDCQTKKCYHNSRLLDLT